MKKGNPQTKRAQNAVDQTSWTIMLYIAADGNLANFAVESLKQINNSIVLRGDSTARVVVAAQFAVDAPAGQQIPRYVFDQHSHGSINNSLKDYLNAPSNMTEQEALTSFLKWVYARDDCKAKKYALILWGHGPELLLQPPSGQQLNDPCGDPKDNNYSLYLTPEELRVALTLGGKKLDLIGFDACSMSMFEMAYELRELVYYMVASQEEVPDLSFPYESLVPLFRRYGGDEEALLREGVQAYVRAYDDYLCNATTGMKRVTLSALRLAEFKKLEDALRDLASALRDARNEKSLPPLLIDARSMTRDFAGGLYVDLFDFCRQLRRLLSTDECVDPSKSESGKQEKCWKRKIADACNIVMKALKVDTTNRKLLVLANHSADSRCHGVSLYLPYLSAEQYDEVQQPMVKGGPDTHGGKSFSGVVNRAASGLLMCIRRELITITEAYYKDLGLAGATGWYWFVAKFWSRIMVELAPDKLDTRYSAQQAAVNACRNDVPDLSPRD